MRVYLVKKFVLPQISHGNAKEIFYSLKMHEIYRSTGSLCISISFA